MNRVLVSTTKRGCGRRSKRTSCGATGMWTRRRMPARRWKNSAAACIAGGDRHSHAGEDGFAVMREARLLAPHTAVILLTAFASVPDAVTAMKGGACDYLVKPVSFERLEEAAERILAQARTQAEAAQSLAGHAPNWLRALDRARQAAASDADVLIEAESGTGKRTGGAADPSFEPPPGSSVCGAELRRVSRDPARKRTVWLRPGRLYRSRHGQAWRFELATGERCCSMRWAKCLWGCNRSCCGFCRSGSLTVWGTPAACTSICASSQPPTGAVGDGAGGKISRRPLLPLERDRSAPAALRERGEDIRELAEHFARLYSPQGRVAAERGIFGAPGNARLAGQRARTGKLRAPRRGVSHRHGNRTRRPGRFGVGSGRSGGEGRCGRRSVAGRSLGRRSGGRRSRR